METLSSNDFTQSEAFQASLSEYLRWNTREQGPLIEDRGRKVSIAIFKEYREIAAPSGKVLRQIIFSETGYRLKRGINTFGPREGKRRTYAEELSARASGNAVLAASWLHRRWRSNQSKGRFLVPNRRGKALGEAIVNAAEGQANPTVTLISYVEGALVVNRERAIIDKVLVDQAEDMAVYVARKHREFIAKRLIGDFRTTLSV